MAGNLTTYAENKLVGHGAGYASYTMPNCYAALYTVAPGENGGGTEVTGGAYTRKAIVPAGAGWNAPANGSITTLGDITFPTATADWGTIVAIGLLDAASSGNLIWYGLLVTPRTVEIGDVYKILAGDLSLSLD